MTSIPPASATPSPVRRMAERTLVFLAILVVAGAITLLLGLAIVPLFLAPSLSGWLTLAAIVIPAIALIVIVRRFQVSPWRWIGGCGLVLVPVFAYLAIDDASLRHTVTIEEITPPFPGAEKSYEVLMRYGKNHPLGRDFRASERISRRFADPVKAAEFRAWLLENRAALEAEWAELAPVHAWWTELNTFDRIGDLTPARYDAEILAFSPVRAYSQRALAIAGLRAVDGHGDEAMALLLPVLEVSRKLEPSARTLVRFMIARVIQRISMETIFFILDTAEVSPATRARALLAVSGGSGGEAGARRLIGIEYAFSHVALAEMPLGDLFATRYSEPNQNERWRAQGLLNLLSPFLFNPRRTFNLMGDLTEQLQELAARREIEQFGPTAEAFRNGAGRPGFKNLAGSVIAFQFLPAFSKVIESYWRIEDLRAKLRARLASS